LLDEPFGQIDNFKKNSLRRKLFSYLKEKNISCIVATHDGDDALSFADQMMVIKNKKVIAFDSPKNLYKSPPEHYVAALFDDVNELYIDGEKKLIYPHQIQASKDSLHKVIVKKSFFKGSFWLIEATFNSQVIFFQNTKHLDSEQEIGVCFVV
jgi:ABC-type sulfate/molybdate transport systems ATPase subunit